jgi:integrase
MSIYRRGSVYWFSFIFDGVRVQRSTKVSNKNDARDIERAAWTQLARGEVGLDDPKKDLSRQNLTIGNLLDGLVENYKLRGKNDPKNDSHIARTRQDFGKKRATELTAGDVTAYITRRLAKGDAKATINRVTQFLGQAFRLAEIPGPKIQRLSEKDNARKGFFSDSEFRELLKHLPMNLKDFVLFAYLTGWRKSEIASLTWNDIEEDVIRLRGEYAKNGESRSVVLAGELGELIQRRKQARAIKQKGGGVVIAKFIFHRKGQQVGEFRRSWKTACKNSNVTRLFHDLRRTAVRNLVRSGVAEKIAMSVSGHRTRSIFDRYNIVNEGDLRDAMTKVEQYHVAERAKVVSIAAH